MKDISFDEWIEIPNEKLYTEMPHEKLYKMGKTAWVYRPSNYKEPLAIDGFIKKEVVCRTNIEQMEKINEKEVEE